MRKKLKKLFKYLPSYPHYKMNVFSGTNHFSEIKSACHSLFEKDVVQGDAITEYTKILQEKLGSKQIYTYASGRMGFFEILRGIGIHENDEVILPSFTCIVVPNAILYSGAKPVYCEIRENDFNIDISKIEALITPNTRVLYAQHTFGQMCDIEKIMKIAQKHNLIVIEDAALSLGASSHGKFAGTIGDFGYYSTDRSKVINTGLGGIVSVNNAEYLKKIARQYEKVEYLNARFTKRIAMTFIVNYFTLQPSMYWIGKFFNIVLGKLKFMTYFLDEPFTRKELITKYPYPAKFSNALAKLGISQILHLDVNIAYRKKVAKYYNDILKIYSDAYIDSPENIFLRYSFLVKNRDFWEDRFSNMIDLSIWFKTIASGRDNQFHEIFYKKGSNQVSEYVTQHIFNLPTHQQILPEKLFKLLLELKESGDIITTERVL